MLGMFVLVRFWHLSPLSRRCFYVVPTCCHVAPLPGAPIFVPALVLVLARRSALAWPLTSLFCSNLLMLRWHTARWQSWYKQRLVLCAKEQALTMTICMQIVPQPPLTPPFNLLYLLQTWQRRILILTLVSFGQTFLFKETLKRVSTVWCQMRRCWLTQYQYTTKMTNTHSLTLGYHCGTTSLLVCRHGLPLGPLLTSSV